MIRPSFSGIAAVGVLLLGAMLSAPATVDVAIASETTDRAAGNQTFLVISTDPTENGEGTIAATGPIHAKGHDVPVNGRTDRFEFPDGNLIVKHKPKKGSGHDSFDPATCLFTFVERGTWKVGDGSTGAYANASGSGTYRVVGQGFSCDDAQPDPISVQIKAKGNLSY